MMADWYVGMKLRNGRSFTRLIRLISLRQVLPMCISEHTFLPTVSVSNLLLSLLFHTALTPSSIRFGNLCTLLLRKTKSSASRGRPYLLSGLLANDFASVHAADICLEGIGSLYTSARCRSGPGRVVYTG